MGRARLTWTTIFGLAVAAAGCGPVDLVADPSGQGPGAAGNGSGSCPPARLICVGSGPDKGMVCGCDWICPKGDTKCYGAKQTPPGGGGWNCSYDKEQQYTCTRKGGKQNVPGDKGWYCVWGDKEGTWKCTKVKTPKPPGKSTWDCQVEQNGARIGCKKPGNKTPPPKPPAPSQPPPGAGSWKCKTVNGKQVCTKAGTTPPGGGSWTCHKTSEYTWLCHGKTPSGSPPPGGYGWKCIKTGSANGMDSYKCTKSDNDVPPGGGHWSCVKGSEFGGTKCYKVTKKPPTVAPPWPKVGEKCKPGTRRWCDGHIYCGWGQVKCLPNGQWETEMKNGKKRIKCNEFADGRRPNTVCACYYFYFNAACCERSDCIVPPGKNGQICPKSAGKLCDYCNPGKPECKESGAKCLIVQTSSKPFPAYESYCGRPCGFLGLCPLGYKCATVKMKVGTTKQCIPADRSCYF